MTNKSIQKELEDIFSEEEAIMHILRDKVRHLIQNGGSYKSYDGVVRFPRINKAWSFTLIREDY